jgi:transposase
MRFFVDWFEFDLLSVVSPGQTIIMDNASFHPKKELRKIAGRYRLNLLLLPPYSPDFNPTEKFWANLKRCCVTFCLFMTHYMLRFTLDLFAS